MDNLRSAASADCQFPMLLASANLSKGPKLNSPLAPDVVDNFPDRKATRRWSRQRALAWQIRGGGLC